MLGGLSSGSSSERFISGELRESLSLVLPRFLQMSCTDQDFFGSTVRRGTTWEEGRFAAGAFWAPSGLLTGWATRKEDTCDHEFFCFKNILKILSLTPRSAGLPPLYDRAENREASFCPRSAAPLPPGVASFQHVK